MTTLLIKNAKIVVTMDNDRQEFQGGGLFDRFHHLVTVDDTDADALDKLAVFAGVREFPVRVKCATLAWHTLAAALDGSTDEISTED